MRGLVIVGMLVACKGKEPAKDKAGPAGSAITKSAPEDAAPSQAKAATPEARVARFRACVAAFNTGDAKTLGTCYSDKSVREQVDSVPELFAEGPEKIVEMIVQQRAAFPDLALHPQLVIVSGDQIAAVHHVSGKNSAEAGGMTATNKNLGIYEAELVTMAEDGTFTSDRFFVDQPTVYHQLGLLANDTSPAAIAKPDGEPEILIAKNDDKETANKALVKKILEAVSKKDAAVIESHAGDAIKFVFHGERAKVAGKKAYMKWMRDTLGSTEEGLVDVKGMWAAGDAVVVYDVFNGIPKGAPDKTVRTNVVQVFRIADGKVVHHEMFVNRLTAAVQLGVVDPEQLMQTLATAAK